MQILNKEETQILDGLIEMEVALIEKGFGISEDYGRLFFSNALNSFCEKYLNVKYKSKIIPSFSTEYRYLIIGILNKVDSKNLPFLIKESIVPKYKDISTEELINCLVGYKSESVKK